MSANIRNSAAQVRVLQYVLCLLCVVFGAAILVASGPQLHDFGEWLFQAQVLVQKFLDPDAVVAYRVASYPVPNSLAVVLMAALSLVLPPLAAGKLFIALLLVCWIVAADVFSRRFFSEPGGQWVCRLVIICCGGFSSFLFYGFVSYQLAAALFVWFMGTFRRTTPALFVLVFSVLIFFAHAIMFLQLGLLILLCVCFAGFPIRQLFALLPSGLLSLWFLFGRYATPGLKADPLATWATWFEVVVYKLGTLTMLGPFRNILAADGTAVLESLPPLYWIGVAANVFITLVLGISVLAALWSERRLLAGPPGYERALYLFAGLLGCLIVAAPQFFFGMLNPGVRMALPLLLAAAAVRSRRQHRFDFPVAAMISGVCLATILLYLIAMISGRQLTQPPAATVDPPPEVRGSVLEFNQWLYRHTRYNYYNYRVFAFDRQLQQISSQNFTDLEFRTGLIVDYTPRHSPENSRDPRP